MNKKHNTKRRSVCSLFTAIFVISIVAFAADPVYPPPPPPPPSPGDGGNNIPPCDENPECSGKCPELGDITTDDADQLVAEKCEIEIEVEIELIDGYEHWDYKCQEDTTEILNACAEWTIAVSGDSQPHIIEESSDCGSARVKFCNMKHGTGIATFSATMDPGVKLCGVQCPGSASLDVPFTVAELVNVKVESKYTGETYYMANDYLDEKSKREEISQDIYAILAPDMDPDCLTWEWDSDGRARIEPVHAKDSTYYVYDHGDDTHCDRFIKAVLESSGCGTKEKKMYISVEGVDMITTVSASEETTKPYNIFLNENFDQGLGPYDDPTCYEVDHSDETYPGDAMDELGQIELYYVDCSDPDAKIKFDGGESLIHLFKTPSSLIEFGTWYAVSELPSVLYVEGIDIGETTLTSTIKTQDDWEGEDKILIKSIRLDLDMITIPPDSDKEEICSEQCVIYVNNDDDNDNCIPDLTENPIGTEDDLFELLLNVTPNLVADDIAGPVCFVDIPSNVKLWKEPYKLEEATCFSVTELPVPVYVEGLAPSANLLDIEIKVELELNSGVMCRDSVILTVLKAEFMIFADQPGSGGDRDTFESPPWPPDPGHTIWCFNCAPTSLLSPELKPYANQFIGYYPASEVSPISPSCDGSFVMPDTTAGHEVNYTWFIKWDQLIAGLEYSKALHDSPGTYNLNTHNCTDAGINAGSAAGVAVPDTSGSWVGGGGSNPGDLGEDLRALRGICK